MHRVLDALFLVMGGGLLAVGVGFAGAYVWELICPPPKSDRDAVAEALKEAQECAERALTSPPDRVPD